MKTRVTTVWGTRNASEGGNPRTLTTPNNYREVPGEVTRIVADAAVFNINANAPSVDVDTNVEIEHQTYILPLMHNGKAVMRERHFENLPQYSGSALTLEFEVLNLSNYYADRRPATFGLLAASPLTANSKLGGESSSVNTVQKYGPMFDFESNLVTSSYYRGYYYGRVEVTVTYIIAALVQNSGGMVELQI